MATIAHTGSLAGQGVAEWVWENMAAGDEGQNIEIGAYADKTIQFIGTLGTSLGVCEGSNDGTNFHTLNDLDGAAISLSVGGLVGVRENPRYIRPRIGSGNATGMKVVIFAKRTR